jgi:two-component system sporulation sensor kinase C
MDIYSSVISSLIGTVSIILIYIYLYALYRERFMGIWAVSWLILLSRFVIFDSGLLPWKQSTLGLTVYQMLIIISVLMFVWGTHIFIDKPLNKGWLYGTISISFLSVVLNVLYSSLLYKLLLPIFICCFIGIWVGLTFIHHLKLQGIGRIITGYAYILWSLLSLTLPFIINGSWLLPWAYSIGGLLRLVIAVGTLLVYFEKTRIDLVNKETQYRLLTENAVDIIYHYQLLPKGNIDYISPSTLAVTGYTPEEYYADNTLLVKLIHPDDRMLLNDFIKNLPHSIAVPLTLRLVRKDKTTLWIEQKCVPIYDEKGQIIALEGIIRDITERKNLEQMASMFDRMNMVGSMAATVAHEIRNPLTTVRGYLQMLERKQEYSRDKGKLNLMIEEIDRANDIIREYLSLSREKVANLKKCSVNNIIEALFPLIQADANSSKVYATLELTAIPELLLDENEIRQLLLNLVRNSIEAMPTGGNLAIRTFLEDSKAILSISDQGSGIPSHVLDHLGTPFITTKDTGTGLGLPICYQIAHRHNANIKIDTSDEGTTFLVHFSLPVL